MSGIILDIQLVSQDVTDILWGCQGSLQPHLLGFMTLEITCVLKVSWEYFMDHQHICALIIGCFHTQESEWPPRSHNTPKTFVRESCWHRGAAEAWTSPDNFWAATWWGILDVTPCPGCYIPIYHALQDTWARNGKNVLSSVCRTWVLVLWLIQDLAWMVSY